jgi:hypothetical protein
VPLVLVVDGGGDAPEPPPVTDDATPVAPSGGPAPAPRSEMAEAMADIGPVEDLEDAGDASTGLDQVTGIFGKVEVLEEDPE